LEFGPLHSWHSFLTVDNQKPMTEIISILSKGVCEKHAKHPQCKMSGDGLDIKACCATFNEALLSKLKVLNRGTAKSQYTA
jgi:hypothetical protein